DEFAAGAGAHLDRQALHDAPVAQVLFDDLVDIRTVHIRVPDPFGVDHDAGSFLATIQASRLVDTDLALARQAELLDALLRVVADLRGALVVAADPLAVALVAAEEHMLGVIRHERILTER